jgi:hypothetical protein
MAHRIGSPQNGATKNFTNRCAPLRSVSPFRMRVLLAASSIPLLALASSCGSVRNNLEGPAATVRIEKHAPSLDTFESLGEVFCEAGTTFVSVASNLRACQNDLRNAAYKLGATMVVVESELLGVEGCERCVSMSGTAYKQASAATDQEMQADAPKTNTFRESRPDPQ